MVATVSMAYAAGPVSPAISAHTTGTPPSSPSRRLPRKAAPARIEPTAATAARTITQRSHGNQDGDRPSSSTAHQAVMPTVTAAATRPNHPMRLIALKPHCASVNSAPSEARSSRL